MNSAAKTHLLIPLSLSAGFLGALTRCALYLTGSDEKGLLTAGHWAFPILTVVSVCITIILTVSCFFLPTEFPPRPRSRGLIGGFGSFLCAGGFLMTALADRTRIFSGLDRISMLLAFAAAAALVYAGILRCIGRPPFYLAHALVCLTFAIRMVIQYQMWSADPQLPDYCFHMLALTGMMLTSYHLAAYDAGIAAPRKLWFWGLFSVYFGIVSIYGNSSSLFIILSMIWILTSLPRFR